MTPSLPTSELFQLKGQLFEMLATREELYAERLIATGDGPAEISASIEALESAIGSFLLERVRSVDDIRNPLLAMQAAQKVCEAEAQRATNQALVWQRQIATVLDMVKVCMKHLEDLGTWKPKESRKLQSALGSISLVGNGGKQPVEIADESLIPDEFWRVTVTMPAERWNDIREADFGDDETNRLLRGIVPKREPSKSAIEAELNRNCEQCEGTGGVPDCFCPHCGGTGKRGVPGARLADRGEHVRVTGLTK